MNNILPPPVPIRPGLSVRYGDTTALEDIRAPTGTSRHNLEGAAFFENVTRSGWLTRVRLITPEATDDAQGMPLSRIYTDGTAARVRQTPDGSSIVIYAVTWDAAEAALTVTVNGETAAPSPGLGSGWR